jgi:ABC-2 type transport system permease protein
MITLDLRPAAAPAGRARRITRHAGLEARLVVRNGEQLLLALAIPLALIVGVGFLGPRLGIDTNTTVASVIALGLWSTGFTSLAITTAFERRYGVLERLAATPLRPLDLLLGKAFSIAVLAAGQAAVLAVAGLAVGWAPRPNGWQWLVVVATVPLALVAFASFALALSGGGSAELTLGLANLIYLVGGAAGLLVPPSLFPAWLQPVLACLPTTALAEALRAWATGVVQPWPVLVTALWAIAGLFLARKAFRWTS